MSSACARVAVRRQNADYLDHDAPARVPGATGAEPGGVVYAYIGHVEKSEDFDNANKAQLVSHGQSSIAGPISSHPSISDPASRPITNITNLDSWTSLIGTRGAHTLLFVLLTDHISFSQVNYTSMAIVPSRIHLRTSNPVTVSPQLKAAKAHKAVTDIVEPPASTSDFLTASTLIMTAAEEDNPVGLLSPTPTPVDDATLPEPTAMALDDDEDNEDESSDQASPAVVLGPIEEDAGEDNYSPPLLAPTPRLLAPIPVAARLVGHWMAGMAQGISPPMRPPPPTPHSTPNMMLPSA